MQTRIISGPTANLITPESKIPKTQLKTPNKPDQKIYCRIFELINREAAAGIITKAPINKEPTTFTPRATITEITKR